MAAADWVDRHGKHDGGDRIEHDRDLAELGDNLAQEFEPLADKIGLLDRVVACFSTAMAPP
jgi:hypothetical protein